MSSPRLRKSIRTVAVFEAVKGALVLAVGCGLLRLLHQDAHRIAIDFVSLVRLDPAQKYPKIFIELADDITDGRLWFFAGLALTYAVFRFVEGYGLWRERLWAEWLALVSGTIYLPIEIYEVWLRISFVRVFALLANLGVLTVIAYVLIRKRFPAADAAP
ncbi:MAG: DUF2127 domain-containing protein [Verrucomicrobiota bacterium]